MNFNAIFVAFEQFCDPTCRRAVGHIIYRTNNCNGFLFVLVLGYVYGIQNFQNQKNYFSECGIPKCGGHSSAEQTEDRLPYPALGIPNYFMCMLQTIYFVESTATRKHGGVAEAAA